MYNQGPGLQTFDSPENPTDQSFDDKNIFQKVSDATGTLITPANVLDTALFVGAKKGIDIIDTWRGIALAGISYMGDAVDGRLARYTKTTSKLGEAVDAAGDKVKLAYAVSKIWKLDLAPKPLIDAIAIQNSINAGLSLVDQVANKPEPVIHPSVFGKRAIFFQQIGLGINVIGSRLEKDNNPFSKAVKTIGTAVGVGGVIIGSVATIKYADTLRTSLNKSNTTTDNDQK